MIAGTVALAFAAQASAQVVQTAQATPAGQTPPTPAFGPVTPDTTPKQDATGQSTNTVQEVVVTGSRIPQRNLTSESPVTTVGSAEAKLEGTTRVEDLINDLPQAFAAQNGNIGNGSTGTATLNLRNLGANRTLVLIDGKRLGPGDPQAVAGYAADVNIIPAALINRIEVLTGGASATYGSDAVAGVVNFILQKDFQGVRIDVTGGGYISDNNNTPVQQEIAAHGYPFPTGTQIDGGNVDVTALFGANAPDGKGNVTGYLGYRHQDPIYQSQRDYGACQLQETATYFSCAGSGTTSPAHLLAFNPVVTNAAGVQTFPQIGPANGFIVDSAAGGIRNYVSGTDAYNYAPFNLYERPDERYSGGFFGHYQVNSMLDLYSSFMFMDDITTFAAAPSGVFGQSFTLPCNSPLFSAAETATLCTAGGLAATDPVLLAIERRDVEGGPRITTFRHTDYRLNLGARGDLNAAWHYDAYLQYYQASYNEEETGEFSTRKTGNALNVVQNADGSVSCANGGSDGCVPYNIFAVGGVSQAAVNYIEAPGLQNGSTIEQIASASLTGDLGSYGIKSPYASDGVGIALGAEYRRESLTRNEDEEYLTGDLAGVGAVTPDVQGSEDLYELFTELRAPILQDMPFAKSLTADAAYRFSDYSIGFDTNTYKVGGDYAITSDILLRASYNHAIRAPNVLELFTPPALGLDGSFDPCSGTTPTATLVQCERTGVTPAQYGHISSSEADQYNGITGGNTTLKPEVSNTFTGGFVLTPQVLRGFSLSADYFDIKVKNVINSLGADTITTACIQEDEFCGQFHRSPTGSLYLGNQGYVEDTLLNSGYLQTKGIDIASSYTAAIPEIMGHDVGRVGFNLQGTYLSTYVTEPVVGLGVYDCAGRYGTTTCGQPLPRWRHEFRVTYTPPIPVQLSARWRFFSPVNYQGESSNTFLNSTVFPADQHINAYSYIDLTVSYRFKDRYNFRVGCNNVFNVQPPTIGNGVGGNNASYNGNTYAALYDSLGRDIFAGLTADF